MYIDDGNSCFGFSFHSSYLFIFSYNYLLFHFNFVFKVGEYKIIMKYLNYNKLQFVRTYCAVYCRIMWIVYDCLFTKWNWIHLCEWICMAWSEVMPAGPIEWIVIQIQTKWIPIIRRAFGIRYCHPSLYSLRWRRFQSVAETWDLKPCRRIKYSGFWFSIIRLLCG